MNDEYVKDSDAANEKVWSSCEYERKIGEDRNVIKKFKESITTHSESTSRMSKGPSLSRLI